MAKEIYVRLKDTGTTFHDSTQGKGVVGKRIACLLPTENVLRAVKGGALEKLDDKKGKEAFDAQEEARKKEAESEGTKTAPAAALANLDTVTKPFEKMNRAELEAEVAKREGLDAKDCVKNADFVALLKDFDAKAAEATKQAEIDAQAGKGGNGGEGGE